MKGKAVEEENKKMVAQINKINIQIILLSIAIIIEVILIGFSYQNIFWHNNVSLPMYSEQEIAKYNEQFQRYEGTQMGTQVKSLLSKIIVENRSYESGESNRYICFLNGIYIEENQIEEIFAGERNKIVATKTYMVTFDHDETGFINAVTIEKK